MELTFLGTGCMVPTKERNVQGIFLDYNGEGMLIDCGEGTQRQMNIAGINRNRVKRVLISHWHGDHVSGLVGLIQTIGNQDNQPTLHIYGPQGTKERMYHLMNAVAFDNKVQLKINELKPKGEVLRFFENNDFSLECIELKHGVPCLGYRFQEKDKLSIQMSKVKKLGLKEGPNIGKLQRGQTITFKGKEITPEMVSNLKKGKSITFILDTEQTKNIQMLAEGSDVLIIETTYMEEHEEKAEKYRHLTTKQVALIANNACVKKLILTHFSQRYTTGKPIEEEARTYFPESYAAYDFMKLKL